MQQLFRKDGWSEATVNKQLNINDLHFTIPVKASLECDTECYVHAVIDNVTRRASNTEQIKPVQLTCQIRSMYVWLGESLI